MDRDVVYSAIDSERDFQDAFLKHKGLNSKKSVGEFLTLIRTYSSRADYSWTGSPGDAGALEEIRKIAAICVSCMETHGIKFRAPFVTGTPSSPATNTVVANTRRTPFQNIIWTNVVSSNIQSIRHDPHEQMLQIRFRDGNIYQFTGVPQSIYYAFIASPSKGKFFHSHIRGAFTSEKVG